MKTMKTKKTRKFFKNKINIMKTKKIRKFYKTKKKMKVFKGGFLGFKPKSIDGVIFERKNFPYDLKATKENVELHVEVKGKSDTGEKVIVSRNEVKHSKENALNSVFILVRVIPLNGPALSYSDSVFAVCWEY